MKYTLLCIIFAVTAENIAAQTTPSKPKPGAKPVTKPAAAPLLKNYNDSLSYVLGEVAAYNLINQGFGEVKINTSIFTKAFTDITGKKQTLIDDVTANTMLSNYIAEKQKQAAKPNIEAGEKFLQENKKKPGVITTASGLQYEILRNAEGEKPAATDTFVCHYRGTLINGTEFDASYNRNEPLTLAVNQVIAGWTEGLQLMPVGSKFKFYIPHTLGYGLREAGTIPAGSALIFEVELLEIKKRK